MVAGKSPSGMPRSLFRVEALRSDDEAEARPPEAWAPRWPTVVLIGVLAADIAFAVSFAVPEFAEATVVTGDQQTAVALLDPAGPVPGTGAPASVRGTHGHTLAGSVTSVDRLESESARAAAGLPEGVPVPSLAVRLRLDPAPAGVQAGLPASARIRLGERSLVALAVGLWDGRE
ncbi:hypothetical protein [Plantactinospora sp. CA-290183]|uniref:hypothetical protein n=1 Tax=Plantactinospora sp. CA-290183 TaxID=3240006 RepID=UPI003D8D7E16